MITETVLMDARGNSCFGFMEAFAAADAAARAEREALRLARVAARKASKGAKHEAAQAALTMDAAAVASEAAGDGDLAKWQRFMADGNRALAGVGSEVGK